MIDASLLFAGSQAYLLYKEDPDPRARRAGHVKRIVIRRVNFSGVARNRVELGGIRELLRAEGREGISVEAPTMVFKDGRYYLFYSGGDYTDRSYGVGVARSVRPNGGFHRLPGNPIVGGPRKSPQGQCGVGHQDVTFRPGPAEGWRIYYHYAPEHVVRRRGKIVARICNTGGRRLTHEPLAWPAGGRPNVPRPAGAHVGAARSARPAHLRQPSAGGERRLRAQRRPHRRRLRPPRRRTPRLRRVITDASTPAFLSPFYDENDSRRGCANVTFSSRVASCRLRAVRGLQRLHVDGHATAATRTGTCGCACAAASPGARRLRDPSVQIRASSVLATPVTRSTSAIATPTATTPTRAWSPRHRRRTSSRRTTTRTTAGPAARTSTSPAGS